MKYNENWCKINKIDTSKTWKCYKIDFRIFPFRDHQDIDRWKKFVFSSVMLETA